MKFLFPIAPNQVFETSEDGKANKIRSLVLYQYDNFHFHFDNNFEGKPNSSLLIKSEMRQSGVDVRPFFAPLSRTGLFLGQKAKSITGQLAAGRISLQSYYMLEFENISVVECSKIALRERM